MNDREEERSACFTRHYQEGTAPWELNRPDRDLVAFVEGFPILPCRAMDIGCGTGANAVWLASRGFDVTGLDFSAPAIASARQRARASGLDIDLVQTDFLNGRTGPAGFEFLFDRGCFHSFDEKAQRATFARNAHALLRDNGLWLSFIGSADVPPGKKGPPKRSALDIVSAVEPLFEIIYLKSAKFDSAREKSAKNWQCLMKKRSGPKGKTGIDNFSSFRSNWRG